MSVSRMRTHAEKGLVTWLQVSYLVRGRVGFELRPPGPGSGPSPSQPAAVTDILYHPALFCSFSYVPFSHPPSYIGLNGTE